MVRELTIDRSELLSKPQVQADGSVIYDAILSRAGVFEYFNSDGSKRYEYRSRDEVFSRDSMNSFDGMAAVYYHQGEVSIENRSQVQVGFIVAGSLRQDGDRLLGKIHVTDAAMLARIKSGMTAVSLGYFQNRIREDGVSPVDGKRYDYRQTGIRGNHVAFVDVARAGDDARIRVDGYGQHGVNVMDELKQALAKITHLEIENQKLKMTQDAANGETIELKKKISTIEAERDTLKEKLDKSEKLRTDGESKAIANARARIALENDAAKVLTVDGVTPKFDGQTDRQIQEAVIVKLTGKELPAGKDASYIAARYDHLIEDSAARESTDNKNAQQIVGVLNHGATNKQSGDYLNADGTPDINKMTVEDAQKYNAQRDANRWQPKK